MAAGDIAQYAIQWRIPDLDATTVARYVVPFDGQIKEISSVLAAAITTADAVLTAKVNTVAVSGGTLTITQSGSAAGDVDSVQLTGLNATHKVKKGDVISIESDGAASSQIAEGYFLIDRS